MVNPSWLVDAFYRGKAYPTPFRHSIFSDVFELDTFLFLVGSIPHYEVIPDKYLEKGGTLRKSFYLYPETIERFFTGETYEFWHAIYDSVKSQADMIKKLAIESEHLAPSDYFLEPDNLSISLRLVIEKLPFEMTPHVDSVAKMGVMVIYLSSAQSEGNGTAFYAKSRSGFSLIKSSDFVENSALVMPRDKGSWHGGNWSGSGYRKSLHVYFTRHKKEAAEELRAKKPFFM